MQTLQSCQLKKLGVVTRKCSIKKVFLKNPPNSPEITSAEVSFFNKVVGLKLQFYFEFKQSLRYSCFRVSLSKVLDRPILKNIYEQPLKFSKKQIFASQILQQKK